MPWTVDGPPSVAENWTDEEKRKCVDAANAVLDGGGSDEDAVFACIRAAGKSDKKDMDQDKLRDARDARSKRYGIGIKEDGHLTPPKGYPTDESDYGDPVNYRYPADAKHARAALTYFNQDGQQKDGGYSSKEWGVIGKRLAKLVSKHLDASYEYREGKLQQKERKSFEAIKILRQENGGVVVGSHLLLWGDDTHLDLQGEYFTPETELWLDHYKGAPALFHHGLDDAVGLSVIGHRVKAEPDGIGVWVEDWIDVSNKYWALVQPLLEAERLYYSPGSSPHLVKTASDGRLLSFPVVEDTLTPIPAQHRLLPIGQIKAAYKTAGTELPEGFEPEGATGDSDAGGGPSGRDELARKAKAAKARLLLISLQQED
jgi:hypothetical protein